VEICYRDHDLIHPSIPEEDGKLGLDLLSLDHIVVMRGHFSFLIVPVVAIFVFVMHSCIKMPRISVILVTLAVGAIRME
jgi:hypothetical protein